MAHSVSGLDAPGYQISGRNLSPQQVVRQVSAEHGW
jgi:hypothetical protein